MLSIVTRSKIVTRPLRQSPPTLKVPIGIRNRSVGRFWEDVERREVEHDDVREVCDGLARTQRDRREKFAGPCLRRRNPLEFR